MFWIFILLLILLILMMRLFIGLMLDAFIFPFISHDRLRIKFKVFFRLFMVPILIALLALFGLLSSNRDLNIIFACVLIISIIISAFYSDKKYLTSFQRNEHELVVHYLTPRFKLKVVQLNVSDISDIELVKANLLFHYPATVNVKHKQAWIVFEILDKKLKAHVRKEVDAVNQKYAGMLTN